MNIPDGVVNQMAKDRLSPNAITVYLFAYRKHKRFFMANDPLVRIEYKDNPFSISAHLFRKARKELTQKGWITQLSEPRKPIRGFYRMEKV